MAYIHSLVSDLQLEIEFLSNLKKRSIEQKHLYLQEGADKYLAYDRVPRPVLASRTTFEEGVEFLAKNLLEKSKHFALVSLGCGEASKDRKIIDLLIQKGYKFDYIAVDSSHAMLERAVSHLEGLDINVKLHCADMSSPFFKRELLRMLTEYDMRLFAFIGVTFGNIMPTSIVDTLSNMLRKSDALWLDTVLRPGVDTASDIKLFNRYAGYLEIPEIVQFFFNPLERVGVPKDHGEVIMDMLHEDYIGARSFQYSFLFSKKTKIEYRGEVIYFLPGEKISLYDIRAFEQESFEQFLMEHGMEKIATRTSELYAQVLLKKHS